MSGNVRPFAWTGARLEAALLVAAGGLTEAEVAARAGVTDRQLRRWKTHPEFRERVAELAGRIRDAVLAEGIADRRCRLRALEERWQGLRRVIAERAADPDLAAVPGGRTGLLVRQLRGLGSGEHFRAVAEYAIDTGLLRELREHEKQAAQELGQWTQKHEHRGSLDVSHSVDLSRLSDDDLAQMERILAAAALPGGRAPGALPPGPGPADDRGGPVP